MSGERALVRADKVVKGKVRKSVEVLRGSKKCTSKIWLIFEARMLLSFLSLERRMRPINWRRFV